MNVVVYARYSSHSQTEQSIEGQIAVCEEYAQRNDFTIVGTYIDRALTGTNDKRPQFRKMIEDSNKKIFEGVLVYQLDRFSRSRYDSIVNKKKLKDNGVRVFSAKEEISDDASGILVEGFYESAAEYFSAELSQKVKRGRKLNTEKCKSNGGIPSLGYKVGSDQRYIIDEEKAPIVKIIFDMYVNGYTMADIIRHLNDNHYTTALGKPFNKNSIRTILLNKRYTGVYISSGIEVPGGMPRIISDETFNKASEIMQKNKKAPARARAKTEYLLTTKLFCGKCKEMMTGTSGTSRNGQLHNYYSCNGIKKKKCDKKNVKKDYIEDLVIEQARNQLTEENINKMANVLAQFAEKEKNSSNLKNLEKSLKENEKQKLNLINSLKMCDIDSVRKTIFEEIEKMENEHKQIENEILFEKSQHYLNISETKIKYFLMQMKEGDVNDIRYRKLIINVFVNKVYVYDDHLIIVFNAVDNENNTVKVPTTESLEGSLLGASGAPLKKSLC